MPPPHPAHPPPVLCRDRLRPQKGLGRTRRYSRPQFPDPFCLPKLLSFCFLSSVSAAFSSALFLLLESAKGPSGHRVWLQTQRTPLKPGEGGRIIFQGSRTCLDAGFAEQQGG